MVDSLNSPTGAPSSVYVGGKPIHSSSPHWSRGWVPLVIVPCVVLAWFPSDWPRWGFMWTLAFAIYTGCKWLTWRRTPTSEAPLWKHAGYLFAWPGMNAADFLCSSSRTKLTLCYPVEWLFALVKLAVGMLLLWGVARLVPPDNPVLAGWIGMIAIVMILHFGIFHLLSCAWRSIGVDAQPLMNWPLISRSISEFWGVRWNTAFRDLTHRFLFRPLLPRIGARGAVLVGFLVSGLIHDIVISIPAGGGYGGPTLFFLMQGCAILVSRSSTAKRIGLRKGFVGWSFTMLALLPVFLLFQPVYVQEVIVPFMRFVEALE